MKRIAVLSNVNINPVSKLLRKNFDVYEAEGYGNELELLINKDSSLHSFQPEALFFIEDLMEIIHHEIHNAEKYIDEWFDVFAASLNPESVSVIADSYLYGDEVMLPEIRKTKPEIEALWDKKLNDFTASHPNVYAFPYKRIIEALGEERAFSRKMWYLGKIPHSTDTQRRICDEIIRQMHVLEYMPKKVLVLDLDNTLWGGLAGENDSTPIVLSEDNIGLVYKNAQRVIKLMKDSGVILCVSSKNNLQDAMSIIASHPHMILRPDSFALMKIDWNDKASNIKAIASELNIGLDSIVFIDDSPHERQLVKEILPEVVVPDFPERIEDLPGFMSDIYTEYFAKAKITSEDRDKTAQYITNAQRNIMRETSASFEDYLRKLCITVSSVDTHKHLDRVLQLVNKTNQFNLTTKRYTMPEIMSGEKLIYAFRVTDKFGDNGIVAVLIVNTENQAPLIEEFTMSCRVMGRNIENGIIDYVESDLLKRGYTTLQASYIPTQKNHPVANLYDGLGYEVISETDSAKTYKLDLQHRSKRNYILTFTQEE